MCTSPQAVLPFFENRVKKVHVKMEVSPCKMYTSPHAVCSFLEIEKNRVENVYVEM